MSVVPGKKAGRRQDPCGLVTAVRTFVGRNCEVLVVEPGGGSSEQVRISSGRE